MTPPVEPELVELTLFRIGSVGVHEKGEVEQEISRDNKDTQMGVLRLTETKSFIVENTPYILSR